jgi:hypothetical protein
MNRRRIARTLGAAAGGLLGTAFLPVAFAFADDTVFDPASTETITGLYGINTAPPAVDLSIQGSQEFDVGSAGTFHADESTATDLLGDTNQELLVTSDGSDSTVGTAAGDVPPVGSVIDTYTLGGDSGFANIYSDLASTTPGGADVISDTLVTPFGDINIPVTLDAAAGLAANLTDPGSTADVVAISGLPPLDVAVQFQPTDLDQTPIGSVAGTFDADETTTTDAFGFSTEALLVTSTSDPTGTAAGDVPPVGSVFNTITFGDTGFENIYSDLASTTPGGDVVSDTLVTPFGDIALPVPFDAVAIPAANAASVPLADGSDIVPLSSEELDGINGVPPIDAAIQGNQQFDVDNSTGTVAGTFDADVSTASDASGDIDESILVTADAPGSTAGTAAGDVPAVGSVLDIYNLDNSGFDIIYSDLVSTTPGGADVVSDTLVTPFADFTIPLTWDVAAGLAGDSFLP